MLKIWGRRNSINVQKAMWAVGELGLAHEHIDAGGPFGGLDSDEFGDMNPNRRVPVIDDDGTVVLQGRLEPEVGALFMRALAPEPEVLFLDEPFSALDYEMTLFIRDRLQDIFLKTGVTMLVVSRDLEEAVYLSDCILLLTKRPTRLSEAVAFDAPRPRSVTTLSGDADGSGSEVTCWSAVVSATLFTFTLVALDGNGVGVIGAGNTDSRLSMPAFNEPATLSASTRTLLCSGSVTRSITGGESKVEKLRTAHAASGEMSYPWVPFSPAGVTGWALVPSSRTRKR